MKVKTVQSYEMGDGQQVSRSIQPCPRCIGGQVVRAYAGQEEWCLQCGWSGQVRVATSDDQPRRHRGGRCSRAAATNKMKRSGKR